MRNDSLALLFLSHYLEDNKIDERGGGGASKEPCRPVRPHRNGCVDKRAVVVIKEEEINHIWILSLMFA